MSLSARTALVLFCCLAVFGCDDDDPARPELFTPAPTLDNLWPSEDGRSWTYELHQRVWEIDGAELPDDFTLDSVAPMLALAVPETTMVAEGMWRLAFDDSITTLSGVRKQFLRETLYERTSLRFLRRVPVARPAERLRALVDGPLARIPARGVDAPLLLAGYAWEKTDTHIGTYGDVNQELAWKYLEADLSDGHEFEFGLLGEPFSADFGLSVRVIGERDLQTPFGDYARAVETEVLVDLGEQTQVDEQGEVIGTFRSAMVGRLVYAPTIGPVALVQRSNVPKDLLTDPDGQYVFEIELRLVGVGEPEPGVQRFGFGNGGTGADATSGPAAVVPARPLPPGPRKSDPGEATLPSTRPARGAFE